MKSLVNAVEPREQSCSACAVRPFSVCASLDKAEMEEFEHISRHVHFAACETVFAQEDMTTFFYNVLDGVLRLYKLLPDGRRQIVGFALPGDFLGMATAGRHGFSADAVGPVTVCQFAKASFTRRPRPPSPGLPSIDRTCCAASTSLPLASSITRAITWFCWGGARRRKRSRPSWSGGGTGFSSSTDPRMWCRCP